MKNRAITSILVLAMVLAQLFPLAVLAEDSLVQGSSSMPEASFSGETVSLPANASSESAESSSSSKSSESNQEPEVPPTAPAVAAAPFTIALNVMGGTAQAATVQTNEQGFLPEIPTAEKEGYSLLGWAWEEIVLPENFTEEELSAITLVTKETLFTENSALYAVWEPSTAAQARSLGAGWDGETTAEPANVDGIYQIGSPEELAWFRDAVNAGSKQINAVLTADIDLNNKEWVPIGGGDGYASTCFNGRFDGAGHSVTGLSINATFNFAGLFGYMNDAAAIVQNLLVSGRVVSDKNYVGGIVGALANGTIQNCSFSGAVTNTKVSSGYAGGIVGYFNNSSAGNNPTVRGCVNNGAITGPYAGGITGYGKFGTIAACYNTGAISGATRAGGIAGQLQNNFVCSNCYNAGEVTGSATKGEIVDFLYSSAVLNNCGHKAGTTLFGDGTGTASNCFSFATPAELLAGLGSAYKAGEGGGYPVLAWQSGTPGGTDPVLDPAVTLQGTNTIFVEKGTTPNQTTITLALQDIEEKDITGIVWSTTVFKGSLPLEEIVAVSYPENSNTSIILAALKGGGVIQVEAAVAVGEATYTATFDVSVIPQITYASVVNANAARGVYPVLGETATVQIYTLGGLLYDFENYPALNFKWRYNSPGAADIQGATGKDFLIPGDGSFAAGSYMYVEILSGTKVLRSAMDTRGLLAAEGYENPDVEYVEEATSIFDEGYGPLWPRYGTDENIIGMVEADLAKAGFDDITVTIKAVEEVYGGGAIQQNGDVEYFYANPNIPKALWMAQYKVALTLTKGEVSTDVEGLVVNIPWDAEKVGLAMRTEILSGVTEEVILNGNDEGNIVSNLVLPKVVDGKKWAQIEWTSSDEGVVSVSTENQNTADTFFDPYVGKVFRGEKAKTVTLTAKFNFQFTSAYEPDITLYKTFTLTIPPLSGEEADALRGELLKKIDAGVAAAGFTDYVTKQPLAAVDGVYTVYNDIQYPTTRSFGVDGKYFPVTISSSNNTVIESTAVANAARSFVYRPLPGNSAEEVEVTITIANTAMGIAASRTYRFRVEPLTQAELDSAFSLMALVKQNYFEGLNNGAYADSYSVTGKLHSFQEATWGEGESGGALQWVYTNAERTNDGIIADDIPGWADQEAWRAFRSSDPTIFGHETLAFTRPAEDTFVRISSSLTHSIFGKYWAKFEGVPGYEAFEALYRQPVSEYVMAEGAHHIARTAEELAELRAGAVAAIEAPISATLILADFTAAPQPAARALRAVAMSATASGQLLNMTVSNLEAGTTVFGLFRKVMEEYNYTYSAVGSYVRSITDANGTTLAERDGGPNAGWIYTVNGTMPLVYMNGYTLKEGDVVEIKYTTDYTAEPGGTFPEEPTTQPKPVAPTAPGSTGNSEASSGAGASASNASPSSGTDSPGATTGPGTTIEESAPPFAAGAFDDTYVGQTAEQNNNSHSLAAGIILGIGVAVFLAGSGILYAKVIKKKKE